MMLLQIDLPAMTTALLAALAAALAGNVLVLRRQALMGDALSHMVLPGIVVGFLLAGHADAAAMTGGALAAGLLGAALVAATQTLGRLDAATAMGVVLTAMFAAGVLLLEAADASNVHLDVEHALYGSLEAAVWLWPVTVADIFDPVGWASLPREIPLLLTVLAFLGIACRVAFKELRLTTFDPDFAVAIGLPRWASELVINAAAALAVVAAFDAVGSILVIAMLICPAASARLLTDRLSTQIWASLGFAALASLGGYSLAVWGAEAAGLPAAVNAAGTIAVASGVILATISVFRRINA